MLVLFTRLTSGFTRGQRERVPSRECRAQIQNLGRGA